MSIEQEIRESFRPRQRGFISTNMEGGVSCPPYVIAWVATEQVVDRGSIRLPNGVDEDVLNHIRGVTGWTGREVEVSRRQAEELADIGRQLLALPEDAIVPPLSWIQRDLISHLIALVDRA